MSKRASFVAAFIACAVFTLWQSQFALAQLTTGGIVGTVTDSTGSRVPGVAVTATELATDTATTVTSDASGSYSITPLKIGNYTVTFEKTGFQRVVQKNVTVDIGDVVKVDSALTVGAVSQTIEVTGAPPLLEEETSSLGTVETEKRIVELPLNGRNFFKLAFLGPGANEGSSGTSAGAGSTDNNRPGIALAVNGLRIFDNNFLLNGFDNNEFGNGTVVIQPPPDAIEEFRVEENSMSAEFGRGGAMVNLLMRSGTNRLHGTAWEFIRNNHLDARNFFATSPTPFQQNQYGGQLGGPIVKDKMFIFGSIQRTDIRKVEPFISTVPTQDERNGDFTALGIPLVDPYTGGPFPGATSPYIIPSGDINTVGQAIANLYPLPTPGNNSLTNNFTYNAKYKFDETSFLTRFDYNITNKDRLFAHYAIATPASTNPSLFPGVDGGAGSGTSSTLDDRVQSFGVDWTRILHSNLINDARAGFIRYRDSTLPLDFGQNPSEALGILNSNRGGNSSGLSKIQIAGYQQLGDSLWVPETIVENVYQLADTVSWIHGKHTVKFGVDFRRQQRNFFQQTAPSGWYQFSGNYAGTTATPVPLADVLLGIPQFSFQDHLSGTDDTRYWDISEFVQDNIRVTPNLTLNLGLRYELNSPAGGQKIGNFNQTTAVVDTQSPHAGVGFDKTNWAPRLGFAWTVMPKTVVRGAAGIFYAAEGNIFDDLGLNPPNLVVLSRNFPVAPPAASQLVSSGFPDQIPTVDPNNPIGTVRTTGSVRKIPRIYEWNLTIQQELASNWLFQVGYVGTKSNNLYDHESSNLNQPFQPLDSNFSDSTGNFGRPYFGIRPGLTSVLPLDIARLSMFYNAFQTSLEHRFSSGFNVLAAYTFAKSVGTADGNVQQCDVQNSHNIAAEKGPNTPDFRHRLTVSYVYDLPFGKGKHYGDSSNKVAQTALGGWQVSGVTTVRSGEAFDALLGGDVTNTGAASARPDRIANPYDFSFDTAGQTALGCPGHQTINCWFNQAAFAEPALAPGQSSAHMFGNTERAVLRGPDLVNFDFSIYKTFQLGERFGLTFRSEFFNIFNHPNFGLPNFGSGGGSSGAGFVNVPGGAAITQTVPDNQREIQFGLKLAF
jgi:hypothetical protein